MDSMSATTITILGKYALDAGVTLAKEAGLAARETAEKLFTKVLHHLRQKPESKAIADGYQRNPLAEFRQNRVLQTTCQLSLASHRATRHSPLPHDD